MEFQGIVEISGSALDDPDQFSPEVHAGVESQLHWLAIPEEVPRYKYADNLIEHWKSGEDASVLFIEVRDRNS